MANQFQCSVVTPTESVLEESVTYVSFPSWDGQQGVMKGAAAFLSKLGAGPLTLQTSDSSSREFLLVGGFAQMQDDVLTLLADEILGAKDFELSEAEKNLAAAAEAVTRVDEGSSSPQRRLEIEREQQRAYAMVQMARNR